MKHDISIFIALFCSGIICATLVGPHVQKNLQDTQDVQDIKPIERSIEDKIADYDCIIRNSNNIDTIRWYQQKKMLIEFERTNNLK